MNRVARLRAQLFCLALFAAASPAALANVFGDAWACAQGSAQAGYQLAGNGAKALQVLGEAPQCVAYATAGDVPLYATTGALFTLNAIDSSIVSSSNCVSSVKSHAVVPLGKLLDASFGGVVPANLLDAGSQEATDQLWEFMATTPPISEAVDRVECGCTFLESGVSVRNLVEIFTIIAEAGEQCDAALSNVPGYQTVKKGVKAGGTAMNNLGEDIFTDQVQHKDVELYYFTDFDGGMYSYAARSHAAARVLDPGHNWRTQDGATFLSDTVAKLGGGANSGEAENKACVLYFDSHKMSNDNANEVCEAMVQRFDAEYKSMVAGLAAQDKMIKQLDAKLGALSKQAAAQCNQAFPADGAKIIGGGLYDGGGLNVGPHNHCLTHVTGATGSFDWHNPYAAVGSLGTPIDPAIIDAQLAQGQTWYFAKPISMSGARKIAWEAFENNGGDANAAVAQATLAYQMMRDKILKESKDSLEALTLLDKQNKAAQLKNAAGFAFGNCPTGAPYQHCLDLLADAVQVCAAQVGAVPLSGEFPKPSEQAKIDAIEAKCAAGYVGLAVALGQRHSQAGALQSKLGASCPGNGQPLRDNCMKDVQGAIASCQGGEPHMTAGYFISKGFAQDPTADVSCAAASALFEGKWAADEVQIARINGAYSEAAKACVAKVPDFGACQQQVGAIADACRVDLQESANILLGGLSLQSDELGNAKGALKKNADGCIKQMMAVADKMGYGKEAEALMLSQYGNRCLRDENCKKLLGDTLRQCQGLPAASAASDSAGASRRSGGGMASMSRRMPLARAPNPVTAVMNNPSAFQPTPANMVLAKDPAAVVADCADELEAALAKANPQLPSSVGGGRPAPVSGGRTPPIERRPAPVDDRRAPAPIVLQRVPAPVSGNPIVTLQPGMDRMGGDYRGFALDQADPQRCRQACADDNACRSYTYVRTGLKGPQAMCFLKNSTPPATPDECCTSGAKQELLRTIHR